MTSEQFEKIYELYFKDVYYFVLALSKNPHIAEDISSETFLKAIKAIDKFRGDSSVRTWLFQIGKNEYFSYLRKNKNIDFVDNLEIVKEDNNLLERQIISKNQVENINKMIALLGEPYSEVFILRH